MTAEERIAKGLAALSGVLAVIFLIAPARATRLMGLPPSDAWSLLLRIVGLREAATGALLATQQRPVLGSWARVAGDVMDALLLALGARDRAADRRALAATAAAA